MTNFMKKSAGKGLLIIKKNVRIFLRKQERKSVKSKIRILIRQ